MVKMAGEACKGRVCAFVCFTLLVLVEALLHARPRVLAPTVAAWRPLCQMPGKRRRFVETRLALVAAVMRLDRLKRPRIERQLRDGNMARSCKLKSLVCGRLPA